MVLHGDFAVGHASERDAKELIGPAGGKVVGRVSVPLGTSDFSSFLLQAQSSGADLIDFSVAGVDLQNVIKQAAEFGISRMQKLVCSIVTEQDIRTVGPALAGGLVFAGGRSAGSWTRRSSSRSA